MLCILKFSTALGNALIHANKPGILNRPGRPSKRASCGNSENSQSKRASVPTPCLDIRYDQIRHWLELSSVPSKIKNKMFKMQIVSLLIGE